MKFAQIVQFSLPRESHWFECILPCVFGWCRFLGSMLLLHTSICCWIWSVFQSVLVSEKRAVLHASFCCCNLEGVFRSVAPTRSDIFWLCMLFCMISLYGECLLSLFVIFRGLYVFSLYLRFVLFIYLFIFHSLFCMRVFIYLYFLCLSVIDLACAIDRTAPVCLTEWDVCMRFFLFWMNDSVIVVNVRDLFVLSCFWFWHLCLFTFFFCVCIFNCAMHFISYACILWLLFFNVLHAFRVLF